MTVEIDMDIYLDLLDNRRKFCEEKYDWTCPNCVWDYVVDLIEQCGIDKRFSDPKYVVDNLIVNGDYGSIDNYKDEDETDEQYIERVKDNLDFIEYFPEDRIVLFSLGF